MPVTWRVGEVRSEATYITTYIMVEAETSTELESSIWASLTYVQ